MNDELIDAIKTLTQVMRGISASLGIIVAIMILKSTNSNDAIRSLTEEVRSLKSVIAKWKDSSTWSKWTK